MRLALAILMIASSAFATDFTFFGEGVTHKEATYVLQDGRQAAITLPTELPANEMYLAWPKNQHGYGEPIAINKAEAWWITPSLLSPGDSFSIYGRNLDLGEGLCQAYIDGFGWVTNSGVNPYKADFVLPDLPNGSYTIYAHNGKGDKYGWADGIDITVRDARDWGAGSNRNVVSYGADPTGATDALDAIKDAISDADDGDTIYFPTGTYAISSRIDLADRGGLRIMGDGMDASDIRPIQGFYDKDNRLFDDFGHVTDFVDITFNGSDYGMGMKGTLLYSKGTEDVRLTRVRFSQQLMTTGSAGTGNISAKLASIDHLRVIDCEFILNGVVSFANSTDVLVSGCKFRGMFDQTKCTKLDHASGLSFIDNDWSHLDDSDDTDGYGWGSGRFLQGVNFLGLYAGGNSSVDATPRLDPTVGGDGASEYDNWYGVDGDSQVNQNTGEWLMTEGGSTVGIGMVDTSTENTTTLSVIDGNILDGRRMTITSGTGFGQSRRIASVSENDITVDRPWLVVPDNTSFVLMDECASRVIVYENNLDGAPRNIDVSSRNIAIVGFEPYNGSDDWIIDGNYVHEYRGGAVMYSRYHAIDKGDNDFYSPPTYFNYIANNTFDNCMDAIKFVADNNTNDAVNFVSSTNFMGNIVINNTITNGTGQATKVRVKDNVVSANKMYPSIFEGNTGYGATTNLTDWDSSLWITNKNTWNGVDW